MMPYLGGLTPVRTCCDGRGQDTLKCAFSVKIGNPRVQHVATARMLYIITFLHPNAQTSHCNITLSACTTCIEVFLSHTISYILALIFKSKVKLLVFYMLPSSSSSEQSASAPKFICLCSKHNFGRPHTISRTTSYEHLQQAETMEEKTRMQAPRHEINEAVPSATRRAAIAQELANDPERYLMLNVFDIGSAHAVRCRTCYLRLKSTWATRK
ncbi:uncharacterized protein EDB93DRAFT_216004 [Suillus bovinus]|uniref:uncharacterized protein n=1 Tax=Suillus bovinus TaxID=48563 RepID=UPI001B86D43A|nr:uncharacterized protein EDB93DRAFT_216004 [Suillus bovinus]KAG2127304.1 hypothetical protein EDB93DRAFT_216004 [Suillus bovinus]